MGMSQKAKRARHRESIKSLTDLISASTDVTNSTIAEEESEDEQSNVQSTLTTVVGEQLYSYYQVYELPSDTGDGLSDSFTSASGILSDISSYIDSASTSLLSTGPSNTEVVVNKALIARIESLEVENHLLKSKQAKPPIKFCLDQIKDDDKLFNFYTGFGSYELFKAFFDEFLGPVVSELNYWGSKQRAYQRHYDCKLNPMNQLFLTLVKLRLNLKVKDLAFRFGISTSTVSRYITTWICFLYHHLKELDWSPSFKQVMGTLPHSFQTSYSNTYAIIDGSEIFLETPSDLFMQSST